MNTNEQSRAYNQSFNFLQGKNAKQDLEKSFALNVEAANVGDRDAILAMGWYYIRGVGVERDPEKAKKCYRKSARLGEPKAMFSLGQIANCEKDFSDSLVWLKRAAKLDHARSIYSIGRHYWNGQGVEQNNKEAMKLFHQAADEKADEALRLLKFFRKRKPYKTPTMAVAH